MKVYIPDENIIGEIETLMAHGAIVTYTKGGFRHRILMSDEDYKPLEEIFFDHEVDE